MNFKHLCFYFTTLMFFSSCEEPYTPEIVESAPEIVVEGYITAGENATPPYVILTKSFPFYAEFNQDALDGLFVHDAIVTVNDGTEDFALSEICLDDIPEELLAEFAASLGINPDSIGINFCIYTDLSFSLTGSIGKTYSLDIDAEGKKISASTTIPNFIGLDSMYFKQPPGEPSDTLRELRCFITDPADEVSFYRYFTDINGAGFVPGFNSVIDDSFFDGQNFEFPLAKGESRTQEEFDQATFGLYKIGDTATIRWATLDTDHFDFWLTLEFNAVNQGPFSSYTRIASNVEGGLGIWGGYSIKDYVRIVE